MLLPKSHRNHMLPIRCIHELGRGLAEVRPAVISPNGGGLKKDVTRRRHVRRHPKARHHGDGIRGVRTSEPRADEIGTGPAVAASETRKVASAVDLLNNGGVFATRRGERNVSNTHTYSRADDAAVGGDS